MRFCICCGHTAKQDFKLHIYTVTISSGYIRNNCVAKRLCKEQTLLSTFSSSLFAATLITIQYLHFLQSYRNENHQHFHFHNNKLDVLQPHADRTHFVLWLELQAWITWHTNRFISPGLSLVNMWRYTIAITVSLRKMWPNSCKYMLGQLSNSYDCTKWAQAYKIAHFVMIVVD